MRSVIKAIIGMIGDNIINQMMVGSSKGGVLKDIDTEMLELKVVE